MKKCKTLLVNTLIIIKEDRFKLDTDSIVLCTAIKSKIIIHNVKFMLKWQDYKKCNIL